MDIIDIIKRLSQANSAPGFDEQDTVERIIVPVIELAGWDIDSINPFYLRRKNTDNKSDHRRFDLELYTFDNEKPKFVFECKSIKVNFQLIGNGASKNTSTSDYPRQLRNYCIDGNHLFDRNWSVPVLTNGYEWVIFTSTFTDNDRIDENITEANFNDFIIYKRFLLDTNFSDIIEYLKTPTAEPPH
ncbi:MAG: hypothetical protein L7F78_06775 [Syntrophales bacterium LBB04]|nr:hypothetical protein [Syntrophales bacterium LBB04]